MDVNARIKVLTRRITIYKSDLPNKNRVKIIANQTMHWPRLDLSRRLLSQAISIFGLHSANTQLETRNVSFVPCALSVSNQLSSMYVFRLALDSEEANALPVSVYS